jgi:hypothetical protein
VIIFFLLAVGGGVVMTLGTRLRGDRPAPGIARTPDTPGGGASGRDLRRLLVQLTRVEGARLLRHPVFLAGVALSAYALVFAGTHEVEPEALTGQALIPLAGGTFLAMNLAAIRDRRSGVEELYTSLPAVPSARTLAHLLSVLGAVTAGVIVLGVGDALIVGLAGPVPGWHPGVIDLVQGPLAIAAAGALGVVFARWVATPVGALLGPLTVLIIVIGSPIGPTAIPFLPVVPGGHPAWHVMFMASFVLLAGAVAVLRNARRILVEVLACGGLAATVAAGILQRGGGA